MMSIAVLAGAEKMVPDMDDDSEIRSSKNIFNFASQAAGAVVLDKSPASAKGYSHLLNDDKDKYGISTCDEKKWVVIGLSEDILVTSVALANYEKYSSMLREFQLLASTSYPTEKWINLGIYEAQAKLGEQTFNVSDSSVHTRYLKIKFNTHHGTEDLCTLSQVTQTKQYYPTSFLFPVSSPFCRSCMCHTFILYYSSKSLLSSTLILFLSWKASLLLHSSVTSFPLIYPSLGPVLLPLLCRHSNVSCLVLTERRVLTCTQLNFKFHFIKIADKSPRYHSNRII